ncbi:immunity 49 family protein [Streptomyces sp. NPDC008163]|uniref:immunity 49 family protein n=1 Tax=Streptomyces sp. NPDC008163 TaxID=3364818 RepID=UPI0036F06C71
MFDSGLGKSLLNVRAHLATDPAASELRTWEAVMTALQVHSALFATAERSEGHVMCRIAGETRSIPATGPTRSANPGHWINAFWLAIVCRDQTRMNQLSGVPLELLRASRARYDEFMFDWVDTLQSYWDERPGLVGKIVATIEGSHPDVAQVAEQGLIDKILYQPVNLFHLFVRKDREGFNQALFEALGLHRSYWTATPEREASVEGYLALGPLAMACLALDAGFPIEVESEYLPKHLLQRSWVGESPT